MAKLLLILILGGALVDSLAASHSEPPLLIDASDATPTAPGDSSG
ncbi:MAG: hypothetical protein ABIO69_03995 [Sphingomicrobium sp.]